MRIELGVGQAPLAGSCAACGQRFLVVVPESAAPGVGVPEGATGERTLELLPLREPARKPSLREARGLSRSAFASLLALALLPFFFVLLAMVGFAAPGDSLLARAGVTLVVATGFVLVVLPSAFVLTLALVRVLVPRRSGAPARGAPAGAYWHSVLVVLLGGLCLGTSVLLASLAPRAPLGGVLLVASVFGALLAGWVTVRLAPVEPYRHAFVAGALYLALGTLVLLVLLPLNLVALALVPLVLGLFVPLLLLGAWIGVRRAPGPPAAMLTS